MLILREDRTSIPTLHNYVILKGTKSTKFAQFLGFVTKLHPRKKEEEQYVTVTWLAETPTIVGNVNSVKPKAKLSDLILIVPYYKNGIRQGEVAKSSYLALFNSFLENKYAILKSNTLVDPTEFDMLIHKTKAKVNDNIRLLNARLIYTYKLNTLDAKIINCYKCAVKDCWMFDVQVLDSLNTKLYSLRRSDFELYERDEYVLMSAKCHHCLRF